jgi:hypothetical protein
MYLNLIIMRIQSNSVVSRDSGIYTTDSTLNTVVGITATTVGVAGASVLAGFAPSTIVGMSMVAAGLSAVNIK